MKPIKRLAADANVILSAAAGKAALRVFLNEGLEISTTRFNIDEVREYLHVIAGKYALSKEVLESQLKLLPLKVYPQDFYAGFLSRAGISLSGKDEDDIELRALALKLKVPVWSNDRDFEHSGAEVYPTAKLLKLLGA